MVGNARSGVYVGREVRRRRLREAWIADPRPAGTESWFSQIPCRGFRWPDLGVPAQVLLEMAGPVGRRVLAAGEGPGVWPAQLVEVLAQLESIAQERVLGADIHPYARDRVGRDFGRPRGQRVQIRAD